MIELLDKRSFTAKHFLLDEPYIDPTNGQPIRQSLAECHIGHIHFRDGALKDGDFRDIDTSLNFNPVSKLYTMTSASYEAEIGVFGDIRFHNVDHSIQFTLPNPFKVEAEGYDSDWGKLGKGLIWRDLIQDGGHQIVSVRNNSLQKVFHFDKPPKSNVIDFAVSLSGDKLPVFLKQTASIPLVMTKDFSVKGEQLLFGNPALGKTSFIRPTRAWNHRGESVDVDLSFYFGKDGKLQATKTIPQDFIDRTFTSKGAWLECDITTSYYAGAGDGVYYRYQASGTWSALYSGAEYSNVTTSPSYGMAELDAHASISDNYTLMERSCFPIDTSGMGASATVTSATFYVYGSAKVSDGFYLPALSIDHYTTAGYAVGNFNGVRQASDISYASFSISGYNAFALNGTGISNVSTDSTTKLAGRLNYDIDNSPPTWYATYKVYFNIHYSEETGTSQDPYLSATYVLPTNPVSPILSLLNNAVYRM